MMKSYLWVLIGCDCDELSFGKGVAQHAPFVSSDTHDVDASFVFVK